MITTHQHGGTVTVLLAARAINPLSRLFQRELAALLDKLEARRGQLDAVRIGFHPGPADTRHELEHLMTLTPAQAADCMHMLAGYNRLLRRLEGLGAPVLATLTGEVSGHALGLALACHRRVAVADTRLSLPQVRQGLAPVAGEIARTVRLAGLRAAAPWLLSGATWSAAQARQAGLLHAVAEDEHQFALLSDAACGKISAVQPWDARAAPLPGGGVDTPAVRAWLRAAPARLRLEADGPAPAAEAILAAMVEGSQVDFENALLIESRYFCQTAITSVARKHRFSL